MKHRVYVTKEIPREGLSLLQDWCDVEVNTLQRSLTKAELMDNVRDKDAVLCMLTDEIDEDVLDAANRAKIFANYAVGYDNINLEAAKARGILISNTPGVLTDATADLAWALLFSAARKLVAADKFTRDEKFEGWEPMLFLGHDLTGKTLGIVGAGRIGQAVARRSVGFKMKVLYTNSNRNQEFEKELGATFVDQEVLLKESDFISLHVPLTEATRHLIGKEEFQMMKRTAIIINTARGPVIDEEALVLALETGQISGAGLDVYEREPKLAVGLNKLDNVVLAPHIGSATREARSRMAEMAAENILAALSDRPLPNAVQ